jgi:hypothetical protein
MESTNVRVVSDTTRTWATSATCDVADEGILIDVIDVIDVIVGG